MTDRAGLRAADPDRQAVADRLRRAQEEGRLGFAEYDERLARAYAAVSYADLDALVVDLPRAAAPPTPPVTRPAAAVPGRPAAGPLPVLWTVWTCAFAVNLLVWMLVSLGNGKPDYFWPMWLGVPGTVLLVLTVAARALPRRLPPGSADR